MTLSDRFSAALDFTGKKVACLLALGLVLGVSLFAVEVLFAYALQAFLLNIGAMDKAAVLLPAWLPTLDWRAAFVFIFIVGTLRSLLIWAQLYLQGASGEELKYRIRSRILQRTFNGESASSSAAMALFSARAEAAGMTAGSVQLLAIQATASLFLAFSLFVLSPSTSLVVAAAMALLALPLRLADRQTKASGASLAEHWHKVTDHLLVSIKNLLLLQIYGTQGEEQARAQEGMETYRKHILLYFTISGFKYAAPQILGLVLICLIALAARSSSRMPPGVLVSYFYLFLRLLQIFSTANQSFSTLLLNLPQARLALDWWRSPEPLRASVSMISSADPAGTLPRPAKIGWTLDEVGFTYPGTSSPALCPVSVDITPGQTVVVTGRSGAGKSTLINILLGGIKPTAGSVAVLMDGAKQGLESCRARLLACVGYVGPESFLIEGSILKNLAYGLQRPLKPEEARSALAKAECGFVFDLPKGLEHTLTEQGQGLSAGQKQRLSLARALLRRPAVLILDEATSNLDVETESKIVETLAKLKGTMTIVAVTHRPTLLRIADRCLELNRNHE